MAFDAAISLSKRISFEFLPALVLALSLHDVIIIKGQSIKINNNFFMTFIVLFSLFLSSRIDAVAAHHGVNTWFAAAETLVKRHRRFGASAREDVFQP